ncbi:MAG: patatin-like phospholipase family protein [Candidatus Nanoarchaeia archaeon]|nr:patatin-like phospholipase family protein [Candidatus Nanoarchaeia archaeon]
MHHVILVLQGGGAKGSFEIGVLSTLEKKTERSVADLVDLIVSTSIGSVNASLLASKIMSAEHIGCLMLKNLPTIFKKRLNIPLYDRKKYSDLYKKHVEDVLGKKIFLKDLDNNVHLVFTSTNMCDGTNHFFKSDKYDEKEMSVVDVVCRSFAAPLYFGQINDPEKKAIWLDGGCGIENLPLWQAYIEAVKRGWLNEGHTTHILSIGCGYSKFWVDYKKGIKGGKLRQAIRAVKYYNSITRGSLAYNQSAAVQISNMEALSRFQPNFSFQHIDWPGVMSRKLDKMDNTKARLQYYDTGVKQGNLINRTLFYLNK